MAFNAFLKLDGIDGEVTETGHEKWINVLKYEIGVSQQTVMSGATGGRGAGRADFQVLTVDKVIDKSSPNLALFCANGKHIAKATLDVCMSSAGKKKFASVLLENVTVASIKTTGSPSGQSPRPEETVSFAYGKVTWVYTPIKNDGSADPDVKQGWDLEKNAQA